MLSNGSIDSKFNKQVYPIRPKNHLQQDTTVDSHDKVETHHENIDPAMPAC